MGLFDNLKNKSIISFDGETDGLWGDAFCIGAVKYDSSGKEVSRFLGRCNMICSDDWVKENVLPSIASIPITYPNYKELLIDFFNWYKNNSTDTAVIIHMGHIVESKIVRDAHSMGIIGDWEAPYLWYDVCLFFDDSVDNYIKINNIDLGFEGDRHNPLYDSISAYKAYRHFIYNN